MYTFRSAVHVHYGPRAVRHGPAGEPHGSHHDLTTAGSCKPFHSFLLYRGKYKKIMKKYFSIQNFINCYVFWKIYWCFIELGRPPKEMLILTLQLGKKQDKLKNTSRAMFFWFFLSPALRAKTDLLIINRPGTVRLRGWRRRTRAAPTWPWWGTSSSSSRAHRSTPSLNRSTLKMNEQWFMNCRLKVSKLKLFWFDWIKVPNVEM